MSGELLGTIGPANTFPDSQHIDEKPLISKSTVPSSNRTTPPTEPQQNPSPKPSPPPPPSSASLPPAFLSKKRKILLMLHPSSQDDYSDKSPKGSVDTKISSLINEINAYPGLVTTSSCAGRVSAFLEGAKTSSSATSGTSERAEDGDDIEQQQDRNADVRAKSSPVSVPGGKGLGGRWLFVSHEPLENSPLRSPGMAWSEVFNLSPYQYGSDVQEHIKKSDTILPRLIKFAFEPLILHVLCADLRHAAPLLAAAMNAGFRESGVQSLKGTDAGERGGGGDGVMVGIRTAGLGMESLIGVLEGRRDDEGEEICRAIVAEDYLDLLVRVSEERFRANEERRERLRKELKDHMVRFEEQEKAADGWEDKDARARRKRTEGLQRKEQLRREQTPEQQEATDDAQGGFREDLEHK
jgi:tRNA wybutosine-synthesizing protein 3